MLAIKSSIRSKPDALNNLDKGMDVTLNRLLHRLSTLRYRHLTMRWKLFIWIVPFALLAIAITGGYSYSLASKLIVKHVGQAQANLAKKSMDQLNYLAQDAIDFSNYLFLNQHIQQLLADQTDPIVRKNLFSSLSTLMITKHSIQSVILYSLDSTSNNHPFAINHAGIASAVPFDSFYNSPLYEQTMKANGNAVWSLMSAGNTLFDGDRQTKLVLSKVIKDSYDLKAKGIVVLGLNEAKIREQYVQVAGTQNEVLLIDDSGNILSASNSEWQAKHASELPFAQGYESLISEPGKTHMNSKQWVISHDYSQLTGWHLFIVQEKKHLLAELDQIGILTMLIMIAGFIITIIITWLASSFVTNPLKTLLRSMRKLQMGDFNQRVSFQSYDEIGRLGEGYNSMVVHIKSLIDEVYSMQLKQREAELKALQAQIHPHFLYNTLDTICWTAQKRGQKDIAELVYALSNLFRISLSDGRDVITLQEELELVRNYLFLQQQRFKERLQFEINVVELDTKQIRIPKLLLQPLIENAVIHGIEPLEGQGFIQVYIFAEHGKLKIDIMDNGIGIAGSKLDKLNAELGKITAAHGEHPAELGFALANIKERLLLIYGLAATFSISSVEHKGTLVSMSLPIDIGGLEK